MPADISVALFSVLQSLFSVWLPELNMFQQRASWCHLPSPLTSSTWPLTLEGHSLKLDEWRMTFGMWQLVSRAGRAPSCNKWPRMGYWIHQFPRELLSGCLGEAEGDHRQQPWLTWTPDIGSQTALLLSQWENNEYSVCSLSHPCCLSH